MGFPYMNLNDAEEAYEKVNGSRKGITAFMTEAKKVATRFGRSRAYVFKDEEALFEVFKEQLPDRLETLKIKWWGEIIQMLD